MIHFKTIRFKNILAVGNQFIEVKLDKSPSTVITGKNGAGKSTVLDALTYALFGKPYRSIKIPQLVNSINQGDMIVEIEFKTSGKEYKIIRGHNPRIFEIYENDKMIDQDASKRDYQRYLEENILGGLNEVVFKQVVVIGSANYRPFMQLYAGQRREVIEELLDVKIFSQMLGLAKEQLSTIKSNCRELDYNIELQTEKLKLNKDKIDSDKADKAKKIKSLQERILAEQSKIEKNEDLIKGYNEKKEQIEAKVPTADMLEKSVQDLKTLQSNLKKVKSKDLSTIEFYSDNDVCPTCSQDIDEDHKVTLIESSKNSIKDIDEGLGKVQANLKKKAQHLKKFEELKTKLTKINNTIYKLETQNRSSDALLIGWRNEIQSIVDKKVDRTILETIEKDLTELKDKRKKEIESQDYYTVVAGMLRDSGIKSKIIKQYIPLMNKVINEYLIRLNLPVNFTLDENFSEVIRSRHRDVFQYANFSEGEKSRIDIAILLSWRHIAKTKNTINTNLLIFDETFDSSLDETATDELLVILNEMKNQNIFVISHKTDLTDKLESHIQFTKNGNFTIMEQRT